MKLKIPIQLDEKFKKLAEKLPPMQIQVDGIPQTLKGTKLMVNHHAEILCYYAKGGRKAVQQYVNAVMKRAIEAKIKVNTETKNHN